MEAFNAWMLDILPEEISAAEGAPQASGVGLMLIGEDGSRGWWRQPFPVTFYAAGAAAQLQALQRRLEELPGQGKPRFFYTERRDLFQSRPLRLLGIEAQNAVRQNELFNEAWRFFPGLTYYDADIPLALRYAAASGIFPLCKCRVQPAGDGVIGAITPLITPWELEPLMPPLRILTLETDCSPAHGEPRELLISWQDAAHQPHKQRLALEPARPMLVVLAAVLHQFDPDILVTAWGDGWLLPRLLELAEQWNIALPLNRHPEKDVERRKERSYFSYGQVIYRDQQVHLVGRCHVDRYNAMLYHDYGLEGIFELGRVTGLPLQTVARVSPGSGISAMQIVTALRQNILVPWHKQQTERLKTAAQFLTSDQGGLVYQPIVGVHRHVAELDFISMYPSIMVHCNISPEVKQFTPLTEETLENAVQSGAKEEKGLIPQTLAPLLGKRLAIKRQLAKMPAWDPRRRVFKAWASAHKWLLVTCFGYLGYRNARFGRIEAHEAVTAFGREALLRAKEAAEEMGFNVLHMYVDGLWVQKKGCETPADFDELLEKIYARTGLPIANDGVYHWIAFLPSRVDGRLPVPNRYFGVFQDGSTKERGIEARRRDTAQWIAGVQMDLLKIISRVSDPARLREALPEVMALLRSNLAQLRAGKVPLEGLVVSQKLSRKVEEYRSPSPAARAAKQLEAQGKELRPGQMVQFIYTLGEPGVHAWDLAQTLNPAAVDLGHYRELLLRAADTVLYPLGISAKDLQGLLLGGSEELLVGQPDRIKTNSG
jgi:DNA polymerase II